MIVWIRTVVGGEYTPDSVFIKLQTKGQVDLLGDAGQPNRGLRRFISDDGIDDFCGRSLGSRFTPTAW